MNRIIEGVTIESFPDAVRQAYIRPGQRFSIMIEEGVPEQRGGLADIAARMRKTAEARGLTTEIFDDILAHP